VDSFKWNRYIEGGADSVVAKKTARCLVAMLGRRLLICPWHNAVTSLADLVCQMSQIKAVKCREIRDTAVRSCGQSTPSECVR